MSLHKYLVTSDASVLRMFPAPYHVLDYLML